ncbi:sodium- and chloride-dependent glycine transporter 1-like isoform X2 [Panulirus ornatus]|uniref:sodium- and chloride-dependent glycine transporter 1-like isoform X2 n=1 Tax=Panulirus ornatus TaxID=150431 RepID=UPI003A88C617
MEVNTRHYSLDSTSSLSIGSPASLGSGQLLQAGRTRGFSTSSSLTNRTHRSSRIEMVEMPGGAVLLEVAEEQDDLVSLVGRRDSLSGARTVGGLAVAADTTHFDKKIKKEMAHHSPGVGDTKKEEASEVVTDVGSGEHREDEEPLLVFGATNLLQHLFLALASPAVFRLPALAHKWSSKNGSGFFTAYVVVMVVVALPLSVLEQTMAQFSSLGATTIFRCLPLLTGVGVGMVTTCAILMLYSSTVLAWAVRYIFDCLQKEVPWTHCPNNHTSCWEVFQPTSQPTNRLYIPSDYYFLKKVVGVLDAEEGHAIYLPLALTQGFIWLGLVFLVYLGEAWQGGMVSKIWSLVTVAMLTVLMITGLELVQSGPGLSLVFNWNGDDLRQPDIWLDAFGQVMWTLGPALGLLITRASYKRFRDRIRLDAYTAVVANLLVAVMLCLAVFPFHGHLSLAAQIDNTAGYFFVISSFAVTQLKVPQLGGIVLYLGVCKALLDHTQMLASTVAVNVSDLLPVKWRSGWCRFVCHCVVCGLGFIFSLPFITKEGIFLVRAVDAYLPWVCGLTLGALEVTGFVYLYGAGNIGRHFKLMVRDKTLFFLTTWKFVLLPAFLALGVWACVVGVQGPVKWMHLHLTPAEENVYREVGLVITLLPLAVVVVATLLILFHNRRSLRSLMMPRLTWGPALEQHRALLSAGVLMAKTRAPYVIVQVETEESDTIEKGWLPWGYFWLPSKKAALYLRDAVSSTDTLTRVRIAACLKTHFGAAKDEDTLADEVDRNHPRVRVYRPDNGVTQMRRCEVAGSVGNHYRTISASLSSGVVLHPGNLVTGGGQLVQYLQRLLSNASA